MKKKVMRRIFVGLIGVVLFFVLGVFFILGDQVFDSSSDYGFFGGDSSFGGDGDEAEVLGEDSVGVAGGESGSGGGSDGSEESDVGCVTQPVQYSLKNFVEDVECLLEDEGVCVEARVNCSVEVYNFDEGVGPQGDDSGEPDLFGVEFSLVDYRGMTLDSGVVERSVGVGVSEILGLEFVYVGSFDVGDLGCGIEMERVPGKCV